MWRIVGILVIALVSCISIKSSLHAGAKDGKIRWTAKQTGLKCRWFPAIKVPEAKSDNEPGIYEIKLMFKGEEQAEFFLIGDGDTRLDIVIYDSANNIVAKDGESGTRREDLSDLRFCRWTPKKEATFRIQIRNWGEVYNVAQAGCN
jgi:hypothetical protein